MSDGKRNGGRVIQRLPMTSAQRRIFLQCQLPGGDVAYHLTDVIRVRGPFCLDDFRRSMAYFIQRHEALRTGFRELDGALMAEVYDSADYELIETSGSEAEINAIIQRHDTPFDTRRPSLLRVLAIHLGPDDLVLATICHHLIFDGFSASVLGQEYYLLSSGQPLPELKHQYSDFMRWQEAFFQSEEYARQRAFWLDQFQTPPHRIAFPPDHASAPHRDLSGESFVCLIPAERLKQYAQRQHCTLFMTLLAAYFALWHRLSGQTDITLGTVTAARDRGGFQDIIGFIANTLALRCEIKPEMTFSAFLGEVRERVIQALDCADYPFEHLLQDLPYQEPNQPHPLFEFVFSYEKKSRRKLKPMPEQQAGQGAGQQTRIEPLDYRVHSSMFPITLEAFDCEDQLELVVEYAANRYRRETLEAVMTTYQAILQQICDLPEVTLGGLQLLDGHAQHRLRQHNASDSRRRPGQSVLDLWRGQVDQIPDNPALLDAEGEMSYLALDESSDRVAAYLLGQGLGPEPIIGVALPPGRDWLCALLGVWKAGAIYLPLDPDHPSARLRRLLQHSRCAALLGRPGQIADLGPPGIDIAQARAADPGQARLPSLSREQLAYILYTSGSSGEPKGVCIGHAALHSHIAGLKTIYRIQPDDNLLQFASPLFDASLEQVLVALAYGARLIIPAQRLSEPRALLQLMQQEQVSVAEFPPAYLAEITALEDASALRQLRLLICGGDVLTPKLAARARQQLAVDARLMNFYGPTEATMAATVCELPVDGQALARLGSIPIGQPLPNTRIHVLNERQEQVPPGLIGEICIAGERLATGYLHDPQRSRQAFINISIDGQQERVYRTGDMGRWLADGSLEFLGRRDRQIQLHGMRIELGEIEAALCRHPEIAAAAVALNPGLDDDSGDGQIHAFIQLHRPQRHPSTHWAQEMRALLPRQMIPQRFTVVDGFAINNAGKIDYRRLLQDNPPDPCPVEAGAEAQNPLEMQLVQLWREAFQAQGAISLGRNMQDLGGNSLGLIRFCARLFDVFGISIPLQMLMQPLSLRQLADHIADLRPTPFQPLLPIRPGKAGPSLVLLPGSDNNLLCFKQLLDHLQPNSPCYGGQYPLHQAEPIADSAQRLSEAMASDMACADLILIGYSYGGYVALEIAQRLTEAGRRPKALILIDVPAPAAAAPQPIEIGQAALLRQTLTWLGLGEKDQQRLQRVPQQELARQALSKLIDAGMLPESTSLEQLHQLLTLNRQRIELFHAYRPHQPIPSPIHLACASHSQLISDCTAEARTWASLSPHPVEHQCFEANHQSLLQQPAVTQLAEHINSVIRSAQ
ncbi:MAG: amino acid adenylation domain-containing protein [Gammaproteobacteria bacterium SHHR-1]